MRTVYFDYNATTPLDPQVREAMLPFLIFGGTPRAFTTLAAERGLCLMMHATEPRACLGASPAKSSLPVEELRVRTWPSSGWLACNGLKDVIL